jgi:uncharacterized protein with PQ loop repeat
MANSTTSFVSLILQFAGPVLFVGLQLSSITSALQILKFKKIGKLSSFPFFSLFLNCLIWTFYGFLKEDNTILIPNSSGLLVSIFCISSYYIYAIRKPILSLMLTIFSTLVSVILTINKAERTIGIIGCILSIIVSGSPLAVVNTVINEKSTASLPFLTSLIMWINNFCWLSYGILIANDPLIYLPNILGFTLSSIQMLLFIVYGFPKKSDDYDLSSNVHDALNIKA